MATHMSFVTMANGVILGQAASEALTADTASTYAVTQDDLDKGYNILRIDTDEPVYVDVGPAPDGSANMFLAVPNYPLLIKAARVGDKVAFAAVT